MATLLLLLLALPPPPDVADAPADAPRVTQLRLTLADPAPGEIERLEGYLQDVIGAPAVPAIVAEVSKRLDVLHRYGAPVCRIERVGEGAALSCTVRRARTVRSVRIETRDVLALDGAAAGLPYAILEEDLKKRVFLRPGEPIDDEDALGRGRIGRQRARIEDFLEREGYYGAQVTIVTEPVGGGPDVDVVVRVRGGSFVKVRRVDVVSFGPISQRRLVESYSRMCLSGEGLLDGVFLGNVTSCFNRRRLQATTDRFVEELRAAGFPEARIRVTPVFVDPRAARVGAIDDDCALTRDEIRDLSAARLPLPPRCVDLKVEVLPGPNIVTRFHTAPGEAPLLLDPPLIGGTLKFLRETFVEPSSRLLQIALGAPAATAADTRLVEEDLRARLTFDDAASVDEAEAELSLARVREYLAERGYAAPSTALVYRRYDDGDVAVDITLRPGEPTPVRSVRLIGNASFSSDEILDDVDLAAVPRSFTSAGFITPDDLRDDEVRLRDWYARKGFADADVTSHAVRDVDGQVDVVFVITEGARFVIDRVIFEGGDSALTPDVLGALKHCEDGLARKALRPPVTGTDCRGNGLIPDEMEADARRVEAVYAARGFPPVTAVVELGVAEPVLRVVVFPKGASAQERAQPTKDNVRPLRLGQIFVEGNQSTNREVLLREMGLDTIPAGSRLDPQAIALGVSRLRRTGLFSRVDVELLGVEDGDDTAHVRITVEERPSSTLDLSVGFSTQQLFSVRLEGREKNLFGTMFDGAASADIGLFIGRFSQVRTQVRWPRLLGTDLSLSFTPVALSYKDEPAGLILPVPSTSQGQKAAASWELPDSRRRLLSAGTALAIDWRASHTHPLVDDKLTVGAAIEARADWLSVDGVYFAPLSLQALQSLDGVLEVLRVVERPANILALTPRLAYSNIDNPFDPTEGFAGELFVRTVPFAPAAYAVVGSQARGYWSTFDDRLTFAAGARIRWGIAGDSGACDPADPQRCEWALMQNDLLRPGGERTVRGIAENTIGVPGVLYDQALNPVLVDGAVQSGVRPGVFGAVVNLEARFTLIRQLFLGELKPALFSDIGISTDTVDAPWRSVEELLADPRVGASVGAGLRYVLPVGPLSLDVAWSPFDEQAGERLPVRIYGALGYIF